MMNFNRGCYQCISLSCHCSNSMSIDCGRRGCQKGLPDLHLDGSAMLGENPDRFLSTEEPETARQDSSSLSSMMVYSASRSRGRII